MAGRSSLLIGFCKTAFKDVLTLDPLLEVASEDDLSDGRVVDGKTFQNDKDMPT